MIKEFMGEWKNVDDTEIDYEKDEIETAKH